MAEPETKARAPLRGGYHHGDLRAALVATAEALLAERGPESFTLRECARRLGVSNAAPAHHFRDITALLTEIAALGFERLTQAMQAARDAAGTDPEPRMIAIGHAYVATAVAHPAAFRLMFHSSRRDPDNPRLRQAAAAAYGMLTTTLGELPRPPGTAAELAEVQLAWSVVHGFATLQIEGRLAHDPRFGAADEWPRHLDAVLRRLAFRA